MDHGQGGADDPATILTDPLARWPGFVPTAAVVIAEGLDDAGRRVLLLQTSDASPWLLEGMIRSALEDLKQFG